MNPITWGYARVSTEEQNEARQIKALTDAGVAEAHIIIDKYSGKDFNRAGYKYLMTRLEAADTLIVSSLDRLGRNYDEMREQWHVITQEKKAAIRILDMPLLDTTHSNDNLDRQFIADITLQILSYVAAKERLNIRQRQRQGIDAMPIDENGKRISGKTGRPTGRPAAIKPDNWDEVYAMWKEKEITGVKAMKLTGLSRSTFYKLIQGNI